MFSRSISAQVLSTEKYGFGKEYLTIESKSVEYNGMAPTVDWANNLTAYQCSLNEDAMEKDAGTHTSMLTATYTGDMNFSVDIPYTYTITPALMTLAVSDTARIYGDENPTFDFTYTGLKNGETAPTWKEEPTITTEADKLSPCGVYAVNVSGGEATNYNITQYTDGTLTVNKREITATANDAERRYGEDNPEFTVTYEGFVNDDNEDAINTVPTASCEATKDSDAGTYAIAVSGGEADNYTFAYEDGTLTINPLTVGFKEMYYSATYNDMSVSSDAESFKFVPEIAGDYDSDDFRIEMLALDKNGTHSGHAVTITEGDYAGKYVSYDGPTYAGKYIFNLTSKGTNPNVTADPSPAYLTVSATTTNLDWDAPETITVNEGDVVELGISYQADSSCNFNTAYDNEVVEIYSEASTDSEPRWYAKGLRAGETALSFAIECGENEWGFYNYNDSPSLSRTIKVAGKTGVGGTTTGAIRVRTHNGSIVIENKPEYEPCSVYDLQGKRLVTTTESVIGGLNRGVYIVVVKGRSHKIVL